MVKPCSYSISETYGALHARSLKFSTVSRSSGCDVLARGYLSRHKRNRATSFRIRAYLASLLLCVSGNRGLASLLKHSPSRHPNVLQIQPLQIVAFQFVAVLKRSWRALKCPTKVLKDLTK